MASEFVRKITDTTINEPINETTTNGDLIITKDDKALINLNGVLKDLTPAFSGDELNELKETVNKNADDIATANTAIKKNADDLEAEENRAKKEEARLDKKVDDEATRAKGEEARLGSEVVHNKGNETIAGNKTFMDGVSLAGKNVVNGLTDTDWLDIPLSEGVTGTAKYKVTMGSVAIHLYNVKGITAMGNNSQGKICTLPVSPNEFSTRYVVHALNSTLILRQLTISSSGDIYVSNDMGTPMSGDDQYLFDGVLI